MLKYGLLVGAMTISSPVLAQVATKAAPASATSAATPVPTAPVASTAPMAAPDTVPATGPTAQVAPATPQTNGAAVQPVTGNQVAQIVDAEFPSYDTDRDGKLSAAEFGAWMVALKTKSDPATKADSPATRKWNDAAFAQADGDKDKAVSKGELTAFLGKG